MDKKFMRWMFFLLGVILFPVSLYAEVPYGFGFQAVVRDVRGDLCVNRVVNLRVSLMEESASGRVIYQENHSVRSNAYGLVSLTVGMGSNATGSLEQVNWKNGLCFLKVEADADGGMDYQLVAITQLYSVPFAIHAASSETVSGTIPFSQISDIPDTLDFSVSWEQLTDRPELFSGSWNDLSDKPELFSGSWNDLTDKPEGSMFSGNYEELTGKPSFGDSVAKYGFSGHWDDIDGKPVLLTSYDQLEGRPYIKDSVMKYGFDGQWESLQGRPDYTTDSVPVWNRLLDYTQLRNLPVLGEDGNFTGRYEDLSGKPDIASIAGIEIEKRLDTLTYGCLSSLPDFADSISKYGFSGRYEDLEGVPDIDSYIIRDYNQLSGLPSIRDTVADYIGELSLESGVKSWNDLVDKPVLKDTVEKYGFSGDYNDLDNRPEGHDNGDLLYWQDGSWNLLPMGIEGQVLTVAGGRLAWVDPSFSSVAANTYKVGEMYVEDGKNVGVVVEVSSVGRYAKIASLRNYGKRQWCTEDAMVETGASDLADGSANTEIIHGIPDYTVSYPVFVVDEELGKGWYLPSIEEVEKLYEVKNILNALAAKEDEVDSLNSEVYWSSSERSLQAANAFTFQDVVLDMGQSSESGNITVNAGSSEEWPKDSSFGVRFMRKLTWAEATSKTDNSKIWRVGDIYTNPATSQPEGIVYRISDGGVHGMVVSYKEMELSASECMSMLEKVPEGWSIPDEAMVKDILMQAGVIEASIINHLQGVPDAKPILTDTVYWTGITCEENGCMGVSVDPLGTLDASCHAQEVSGVLRLVKNF